MPIEYKIDIKQGSIFTRYFGETSDAVIVQNSSNLRSDPDFQPDFDHLIDFSKFVGAMSAETVRQLAEKRPSGPGSRRAMGVSRDVAYGMGRMYGSLTSEEGMEFSVFYQVEQAMEWLGIEEYPFEYRA